MNKHHQKEKPIILKRNKEQENINYSKVYDLSLIDSIKDITQEEKIILLSTIKKIIFCTNHFMDITLVMNAIADFVIFLGIFIFYYLIFIIFKDFIFSEEQIITINSYHSFGFLSKIKIYIESHLLEIIARLLHIYNVRSKIKKQYLFYAKNEINKIKNYFIIDINENNYDLVIKRNKNNFIQENDIKIPDFYQYIICLPNFETYPYDNPIILKGDEKLIYVLGLFSRQQSKRKFKAIFRIILVLKLLFNSLSFYYLTLRKLVIYYVIILIKILVLECINFYYKYNNDTYMKIMDYGINKNFIKKGYLINTETYVMEIIKLNSPFEGDDSELDSVYLSYFKKMESIHTKLEEENSIFFFLLDY